LSRVTRGGHVRGKVRYIAPIGSGELRSYIIGVLLLLLLVAQ
jgi:hypothetical protein